MNGKLYYLARSYYPYQKGGGPQMRAGAVKYLKALGWDIVVVVPNYQTSEVIHNDEVIQIPFPRRYIQKLTSLLERVGVYEDYLDRWVEGAFRYLKDHVQQEDIVLATSGGELGMIKLGSRLEQITHCKFVVNFRDPLNYGYMNGMRRDSKLHIGREKIHDKYLQNARLILTSSQYYAKVLRQRFPTMPAKIVNNYFGYIEPLKIIASPRKTDSILRIAYVGTMGSTQRPELLYQAWKALNDKDIELYFIGDYKRYKPLRNIRDEGIYLMDFMPHDQFLTFMREHIDVGFVSLVNDYFGACVPSKIYEYINLGIPILGALPLGDGREMINTNGYGVACDYRDITCLTQHILQLKEPKYRMQIEEKILHDWESWAMQQRIQEVDLLLRELI